MSPEIVKWESGPFRFEFTPDRIQLYISGANNKPYALKGRRSLVSLRKQFLDLGIPHEAVEETPTRNEMVKTRSGMFQYEFYREQFVIAVLGKGHDQFVVRACDQLNDLRHSITSTSTTHKTYYRKVRSRKLADTIVVPLRTPILDWL
jgi:hypothetical protein